MRSSKIWRRLVRGMAYFGSGLGDCMHGLADTRVQAFAQTSVSRAANRMRCKSKCILKSTCLANTRDTWRADEGLGRLGTVSVTPTPVQNLGRSRQSSHLRNFLEGRRCNLPALHELRPRFVGGRKHGDWVFYRLRREHCVHQTRCICREVLQKL